MNLTELTIQETATLLEQGETTSLQVTNAYLERIDELNPTLNAYLSVFHESARAEAEQSDERRKNQKTLSNLDGIPLALKDNLSTKAQATTAGSKILTNYEPLYDATVVRKLKAAGVVTLGKTNLDEFAMGSSTENSAFGPSKNPWDTSRVPGGSSGGSAVAVAASLCAGALGSDTGGSIRQPAALCGVVGLKPTYGTVSRYGLLAMASSLDQIGPITKTVGDGRLILDIIAGEDRFDSTTCEKSIINPPAGGQISKLMSPSDNLKNIRIGVPKEYFGEGFDPAVESLVREAIGQLAKLGATIVEVTLPSSPLALAAYYVICPVEVASNLARYDGIRYGESAEREAREYSLLEVYQKSRSRYLGSEVKRRIMLGTYASSAGYFEAYYNKAMKVRELIKQEFESTFTNVDCLVTPVSPTVAWPLSEKANDPLAMYLADINTVPVNLAGLPALAVPCGFVESSDSQLPVGLQLIGPRFGEDMLFKIAKTYENTTRWHKTKLPQY